MLNQRWLACRGGPEAARFGRMVRGESRDSGPWAWLGSSHLLNPSPALAEVGTGYVAPVQRWQQHTLLEVVKGV